MEHIDEMTIPHTVTTVEAQRAVWIAGPACLRREILGAAHNPAQMHHIVTSLQGRTDTVVPAWLMPEPQNPHDPSAIIVWVMGGKVGYLSRELAAHWQPILVRLHARYRFHVACQATIDPPSAANQGGFGMIVWLPDLPLPQPAPLQRVQHPPPAPAPKPAAPLAVQAAP